MKKDECVTQTSGSFYWSPVFVTYVILYVGVYFF